MQEQATILTIDDEAAIRNSIRAFLEDNDFNVLEAENGRIGVDIFKKDQPDLILVDLRMPEMDGLEVLDIVHKMSPDTPIIVVSGTGVISDAAEAIQKGAWNYILKPIQNMDILLHVVTTSLERAKLKEENINYQKDLEKQNEELEQSLEQLKKAQERMIQSEKMSALGGLVAGISHEINTPIGIIVTASSFLDAETAELSNNFKNNTLSKTALASYLKSAAKSSDLIMKNANRASELISSFKQVAVDQTGEIRREFFMAECIHNTVISLLPRIKRKNIEVKTDCAEKLALFSYPGAFYQILTNFITNSVFHAFEKRKKGNISITAKETEKEILLIYSDNGKGMSPDIQKKIYEPFFTTKRSLGGTGLGLHIVYNIITQKLKGTLQCKSTTSDGTTYTIAIPKKEVANPNPKRRKNEKRD